MFGHLAATKLNHTLCHFAIAVVHIYLTTLIILVTRKDLDQTLVIYVAYLLRCIVTTLMYGAPSQTLSLFLSIFESHC